MGFKDELKKILKKNLSELLTDKPDLISLLPLRFFNILRKDATLNKAELIERVSKRTKMTKTQTEIALDATIEVIEKAVSSGDEVKIVGFGTFDRASRKQRNGRNPKTGSTIVIPASRVPRFRPGKEFKTLVEPTTEQVTL